MSHLDVRVSPESFMVRRPSQVHFVAVKQSGQSVEQHWAEIDFLSEEWFLLNLISRTSISHEGGLTRFPDGSETRGEFGTTVPHPLNLAFPAKLMIWGRKSDDFTPISVEKLGEHSQLLTIQHQKDPAVRGTVVFDQHLGLVTKVIRPSESTFMRDVVTSKPVERNSEKKLIDIAFTSPNY